MRRSDLFQWLCIGLVCAGFFLISLRAGLICTGILGFAGSTLQELASAARKGPNARDSS